MGGGHDASVADVVCACVAAVSEYAGGLPHAPAVSQAVRGAALHPEP